MRLRMGIESAISCCSYHHNQRQIFDHDYFVCSISIRKVGFIAFAPRLDIRKAFRFAYQQNNWNEI